MKTFSNSKDLGQCRISLPCSVIGRFSSMSLDAGKIREDLRVIVGFRAYFQDHRLLPEPF
jgi:hypothetical protein